MKLKKIFPIAAMVLVGFMVGCKKDVNTGIRPLVTSTDPINNAVSIATNSKISASFNIAMDPTSVNISSFTLLQGTETISGAAGYSDKTATFTPSVNLVPNTIYSATITTQVKEITGNTLLKDYSWSFTTGEIPDVTLPTVSLTDPMNNDTGVARNKVIALTFSEVMDPLTINTSTFVLKQGTNAIAGIVGFSGTTATFTPSVILEPGIIYTASISVAAKDVSGNAIGASTDWSFTTAGNTSSLAVVNLGAAGNYAILAKTAINNTPTSAITGDLGLSPAATSYITGFALTNATGYATSTQLTGQIFAADMASPTGTNLTTAVENMLTAYTDAAGRPTPDFLELSTGNIGGKTLVPGLYKWTTSVTLPSDVTISGGANEVWIFQISGDLLMSNAVNVTLAGGAQAKNIFWQVAGQATFGTTSHFEGIILSMTGITFQTGASLNGRALAQTAVILDNNAITKPQ